MKGILERLLEHNHWATRVVLERCRELSPEQFTQHFNIGLGCIHDSMRHIVGAMRRWTDRIGDRTLRPSIEGQPAPFTAEALLELLDDTADELRVVARDVDNSNRHDEMITMHSDASDQSWRFTRGTALVHVATHGAHHRAQVLYMLKCLDQSDLPDIDAIESELVLRPAHAKGV